MNDAENPYQIRWAGVSDWTPAMNMIWKTFMKFEGNVYSKEGIENFLDFITDKDLFHSFVQGEYLMKVALDGDKIIGAASVRNGNFLSLLFVDENYHMQGVGKALMEEFFRFLKDEKEEQVIIVKSAPYAVKFYEKLGFQSTGPEEHYAGIRVTPMKKVL